MNRRTHYMKADKAGKFKSVRLSITNTNFLDTLCIKKGMSYDEALTILIKTAKAYTNLITV
jgi:hypothetical protein